MAFFPISGPVEVVRIPELPEQITLANDDKIPIWHADTNVTQAVTLSTLRTFIETGSGGTADPVYVGGDFLYIVPAEADGLNYISIPEAAGYTSVKVRRDGYPLKPTTEFIVLDAGGIQLVSDTLIEGQRFEISIAELSNGQVVTASGSGGGFIQGRKTINTNVSISVNDLNKVHQVRGASNALTISLPDVDLCPENSFLIIETLINNTKQHTIQTTGGQYIYMNNQNYTELFIGVGEYVWLYRSDDGWYAIADKGNFVNIGNPVSVYKAGLNQIELNGQLLNRADYPRLWQAVQSMGGSLVSESTWQTASATVEGRTVTSPYRGCYSDGNGSTTFRVPNLNGVALRGIKNPGGSDSSRHYNFPGGFQRHEYESHSHQMTFTELPNGASGGPGYDGGNNQYNTNETKITTSSGGSETRMDNIGVTWVTYY